MHYDLLWQFNALIVSNNTKIKLTPNYKISILFKFDMYNFNYFAI